MAGKLFEESLGGIISLYGKNFWDQESCRSRILPWLDCKMQLKSKN